MVPKNVAPKVDSEFREHRPEQRRALSLGLAGGDSRRARLTTLGRPGPGGPLRREETGMCSRTRAPELDKLGSRSQLGPLLVRWP